MRSHGAGHRGILPGRLNGCPGTISMLNPVTVTGHTVAETYAASLWRSLRFSRGDNGPLAYPGHRAPLSPMNEKENDCPLNGGWFGQCADNVMNTARPKNTRIGSRKPHAHHSEDNDFPFPLTLGAVRTSTKGYAPLFPGGNPLFSALLSVLQSFTLFKISVDDWPFPF